MAEELQRAFDFFNERLFNDLLPACLITLQRERATFGYFSSKRFVRWDGRAFTHEISLNPAYFATRTIKSTLSTLCHEMVHLRQASFGHPGRRGYHNAEWATWMDCIGLTPSDTGLPGGHRIGEKVSHFIVEGGPFDRAAVELLDEDFVLSWIDRYPTTLPPGMHLPDNYSPIEDLTVPVRVLPSVSASVATIKAVMVGTDGTPDGGQSTSAVYEVFNPAQMPEEQFRGAAERIAWRKNGSNRSNRVRYKCHGDDNKCPVVVWGKVGLDVRCGRCGGRPLVPTESTRTYGARQH
ncbi:MAG: SprT-like domain-containing protein [Rhodanobacter sp.]